MDIILCLQYINPNVGWSVNANDYNQITCSDPTVKIPKLKELESAWLIVNKVQSKKQLARVVQKHLDVTAQSRDYENIIDACSFASTPNAYQTESISFVSWCSDCWVKFDSIFEEVEKGTRAIPTEAELIAELPEFI